MNASSHLQVRAPAPDWFHWAVGRPRRSCRVDVEGCPIHYLLWPADGEAARGPGVLLVHGGDAHAHWWSFLAPFLSRDHRVAAIDLSGMGDSGSRPAYGAELRTEELRAVIRDAGLGPRPYVVGHSFGGYMTMRLGARFGTELGGAVIVDSPVRAPEEEAKRPRRRVPSGRKRIYTDFEDALARFRLRPHQACANDFLVEFIGRHSLIPAEGGWTWKFDSAALHPQALRRAVPRAPGSADLPGCAHLRREERAGEPRDRRLHVRTNGSGSAGRGDPGGPAPPHAGPAAGLHSGATHASRRLVAQRHLTGTTVN